MCSNSPALNNYQDAEENTRKSFQKVNQLDI